MSKRVWNIRCVRCNWKLYQLDLIQKFKDLETGKEGYFCATCRGHFERGFIGVSFGKQYIKSAPKTDLALF